MKDKVQNSSMRTDMHRENEERQNALSKILKGVAQYLVDSTVQKILISKNKKNDQIFLSITRHSKVKHRVARMIRKEREKRESKKQD